LEGILKEAVMDGGNTPSFAWRDLGKSWRISARIVNIPLKVWTEHLQNISLESYRYIKPAQ
jgi:hypothetical protein